MRPVLTAIATAAGMLLAFYAVLWLALTVLVALGSGW